VQPVEKAEVGCLLSSSNIVFLSYVLAAPSLSPAILPTRASYTIAITSCLSSDISSPPGSNLLAVAVMVLQHGRLLSQTVSGFDMVCYVTAFDREEWRKMKQALQRRAPSRNRNLLISLSSSAVAVGFALAVLSYLGLIPLGYKLGPYWLNHWLGWLALGFIIIYVPIFVILKKRNPKIYQRLMKVHEIGFLVAFVLVSLHIGSQLRRVFPPEIGTGIAAYISLLTLVVTGIMRKNQILATRMATLRFIHLSMGITFFLVIVLHVIRAFLI
jgi:hypothetical protein